MWLWLDSRVGKLTDVQAAEADGHGLLYGMLQWMFKVRLPPGGNHGAASHERYVQFFRTLDHPVGVVPAMREVLVGKDGAGAARLRAKTP